MKGKKQVTAPTSPVTVTFDFGGVQFEATVTQASEVVPLFDFADKFRVELQKRQLALADAAMDRMHGRKR